MRIWGGFLLEIIRVKGLKVERKDADQIIEHRTTLNEYCRFLLTDITQDRKLITFLDCEQSRSASLCGTFLYYKIIL
jgi:hypothetical protein